MSVRWIHFIGVSVLVLGLMAYGERRVHVENPYLSHRAEGRLFFGEEPFSGIVVTNHQAKDARRETRYRNGWKEGLLRAWYGVGQIAEERMFAGGKRVGVHRGWWPNGNPQFYYEYESDRQHGDAWEWFESGEVRTYRRYDMGREIGAKIWRPSGQIHANYVYTDERLYGVAGGRLCRKVRSDTSGETTVY